MAECQWSAELSKWIPVVGTLLGAAVGFVGGLITSWFTQKIREGTERENRERDRLEHLYETLVAIRMDYQGILGQLLMKVHHDKAFVTKEHAGIPPMIKLNMVIHMYFPSLTEAHKTFVAVAERFGDKWAGALRASFVNESSDTKKKICGEYVSLFKELDSEISNLQQKVASLAKA